MTPRLKKWLYNVLRLVICVAALWYVSTGVTLDDRVWVAGGDRELVGTITHKDNERVTILLKDNTTEVVARSEISVDKNGAPRVDYGFKTAWISSDKNLLLLALVIFLPVPVLQGVRLRWMLRAQGIDVGVWENVKLAFAGNFLNFAAPLGSTGGDVFKAYYISLHTDHKTEAVTTIFLDRVVGLGTLILMVAVVASAAPGDSPLADFRLYTLGFLAVGAAGALAYLSPALRSRFLPYKLLERVPKIEHLRRIDKTTRTLAAHKGICLSAILITAALQAIAMVSYIIVAAALGLDARLDNALEFYAYFATGSVVQALPGPPQGLGTVELAYAIFFARYGSVSQIVCMALAVRIMVLTASLPGLLVTLTGAYKPRDMKTTDQPTDCVSAPTEQADA